MEGVDFAPWVTPFLMPISFLWDSFQYLLILFNYYCRIGSDTHEDRVAKVVDQVKAWREEGGGRKMCTARPSWKSITQQHLGYKSVLYKVKVDLNNVLEINKDRMEVQVEPSVPIGFLNRLLVSHGVTLPVVPEIDVLTIGGLVMGGGIESTSHKYGLFQHICKEYELVTSDGKVTVVNKDTLPEIFYSVPMSYGTLGFLTRVTLRLITYKPYLEMTYRPTYSLDQTVEVLEQETNKGAGNDSVEGIMYTESSAVIMTAKYVDADQVQYSKLNRIGLWYKPWFSNYVQTFLEKGETTEFVPTLHFHQRHNKGMFWLAKIWLPWGHHPIARFLFGWILPINNQLLNFIKETFVGEDHADHFILQDLLVPLSELKESVKLSKEITDVWPLWMVPAKLWLPHEPEEKVPRAGDVFYVDLGIYGFSSFKGYQGRDPTLKIFEKFCLDHNSYLALYAETLMSLEDFMAMFDGSLYLKARSMIPWCEEAFPTVYEKVCRQGRRGNFDQVHQSKK